MARIKMNNKPPGSVELLRLVTEERKTFGAKQLDYHRYHAHCAKKLHAMRRIAGIQQINKNRKFLKKTLKPPFLSSQNLKLQHILVVLFEAERCWAASRELKQTVTSLQTKRTVTGLASASSNPQNRKAGLSKLRSHARSRLSRAVKHANNLLSFNALVPFEMRTLLEVHVYNLHLQGLLAFDLGRWTTGLDCLSLAVTLLKALSKHAHGSQRKDVALYQEWSDNTLPLVRYCAYKLEISTLTDIEMFSEERTKQFELGPKLLEEHWEVIDTFITSCQKTETSDSISLTWKGQPIPSRSLELVDIVLKVQATTRKLKEAFSSPSQASKISQSKVVKVSKASKASARLKPRSAASRSRAFDAALLVYTDAEESIQTLLKASQRSLESNESFQHSNDQHTSLILNHSVIAFRLLSTRFRRDLDLLEGLKTKLKRRELKVERRLSSKSGQQPFQVIDALVANEKNQPTNKKEMQNIRKKMMNRQRANVYPSLLKLYDSMLLDLEKMRQLSIIEDDDSVASMVDCQLAFYQAHRCLIQSRSYHLIEKFPESFALQQKSILYLRESEHALREADIDEEIEDQEEDLISLVMNPKDFSDLTQIQEETKREILRDWYEDCQSNHHPILNELEAELKLGMLSLSEESPDLRNTQSRPRPENRLDQPMLDVAYNYVIDFPLDQLAIKACLKQPDHSNSQRPGISTSAIPAHTIPTSHEEVVVPEEPKKSGGGLWSFFTGR
ncbi:hypothetical protein DFH28DRAFT_959223 [Melampsora americana]|nr:hypothetical protein DFH28DRAFT_959223 [Melampsora americana]